MENHLNPEEIERICSNLRVVDFLKKHQADIDRIPELKAKLEHLSSLTKQIMDQLTDDQRDKVLETHKIQSEAIAQKLQKKK